ncbi:MAG: hypothetical protein JWR22_2855 [Herminiimonas sp.]|nr:hypothetical protein [Herminiimonas sp.]
MKKTIMAAALIASCATAMAASDWRSLGANDKEAAYIDIASVSQIGDYPQAWLKMNYAATKILEGKGYRSLVSLTFYNRAAKESAHRIAILYERLDGEGDKVFDYLTPVKDLRFTPAAPDSFGDVGMLIVCTR